MLLRDVKKQKLMNITDWEMVIEVALKIKIELSAQVQEEEDQEENQVSKS